MACSGTSDNLRLLRLIAIMIVCAFAIKPAEKHKSTVVLGIFPVLGQPASQLLVIVVSPNVLKSIDHYA